MGESPTEVSGKMRRISCWIGIAVAAGGSLFAAKPQSPSSPDSAAGESYRTVLKRIQPALPATTKSSKQRA